MIKLNPNKYKAKNLFTISEIISRVEVFKRENKKIGLCSGSFDLLHPGHISHLEMAKENCDILIVAVAKDSFSKKKSTDNGRPIYSHKIRAFMLSKIIDVDLMFFDDGSLDSLHLVKPNIYIKGVDYIDELEPGIIKAKEFMESIGREILFTKTEKLSTTDIIKYIKRGVGIE